MRPINFKELLSYYTVIIPIIQRDYAQGRENEKIKRIRTNFLNALHEVTKKEGEELILDFVYGTEAQNIFTPLDGQQRLTTLFLLHWYAKNVLCQESYAILDLSRFTYKTHPAARQFCKKLVTWDKEKIINKSSSISSYIKEEVSWWIAEWEHDPTIAGMLTMLDAIHDKFRDTPFIFLDNVKFYLYSLVKSKKENTERAGEEKGISDELTEDIYIKMNARGLELTPFSKLKGYILEEIGKKEENETKLDIASKFDGIWTDYMWDKDQPEPGKVMDGYFIRYIRFVCDTFSGERIQTNDFDMVQTVSKKWDDSHSKIAFHDYLTTAFACMINLGAANLISEDEKDPQQKLKADVISLFTKCRIEYSDKNDDEKTDRKFSIEDTLLLYAFIIGCHFNINKDEVEFLKRLRWVRNLIWNSGVKMEDLKELMIDTQNIILNGLYVQVTKFKQEQLEQEKEKEAWLNDKQYEDKKALYALEDHPLIRGDISVVTAWKDPEKCKRFCNLFQMEGDNIKDCKLLTRALLSMGPIWSAPGKWNGHERYRVTIMSRNHFVNCNRDERTIFALDQLLNEEKLNNTYDIKQYLDSYNIAEYRHRMEKYTATHQYGNDDIGDDWNYYFVKYSIILDRSYQGYFVWRNNDIYAITGKKATSGNRFWDIFLLGIEEAMHNDNEKAVGIKRVKCQDNEDSTAGKLQIEGKYLMHREVIDGNAYFCLADKRYPIDTEQDCVEQGTDIVNTLLNNGPAGLPQFAEGEAVYGGAEGGEEGG